MDKTLRILIAILLALVVAQMRQLRAQQTKQQAQVNYMFSTMDVLMATYDSRCNFYIWKK